MKQFIFTVLLITLTLIANAQTNPDDLLNMVKEEPTSELTTATFKTTRLINFHTTEVLGKNSLDFRIAHRFGDVNSGAYNMFGLDQTANIRLGLEYSPDGKLMMGIGRTSQKKIIDGFVKYRLLRQTTDDKMPISITFFSSMYYTFEDFLINVNGANINKYKYDTDRMSFCHQVMVARKFNPDFSMQLSVGMVHFNLVDRITDFNDCYFAGVVTRYKFTPRQAVTLEYGFRFNNYSQTAYYDSFGIGYDLETGGHVFQLHFTNSFGLTENEFLMYTTKTWSKYEVRLGFNISRVFTLKR